MPYTKVKPRSVGAVVQMTKFSLFWEYELNIKQEITKAQSSLIRSQLAILKSSFRFLFIFLSDFLVSILGNSVYFKAQKHCESCLLLLIYYLTYAYNIIVK
jgi:hypothetical protein